MKRSLRHREGRARGGQPNHRFPARPLPRQILLACALPPCPVRWPASGISRRPAPKKSTAARSRVRRDGSREGKRARAEDDDEE